MSKSQCSRRAGPFQLTPRFCLEVRLEGSLGCQARVWVRQAWVSLQGGIRLWDHLPGPSLPMGRNLCDPESLSWGMGWKENLDHGTQGLSVGHGDISWTLGISFKASAL